MEVITSISNAKVAEARRLKDAAFRRESRLFVVEGVRLVKDMPSDIKIRRVFIADGVDEATAALAQSLQAGETCVVTDKVMSAMSDTCAPQGILAVAESSSLPSITGGVDALLLDGISDPGNLGTIVRTAAACSIRDVFAVDCADFTSGKVVRASMGGVFHTALQVVGRDEAGQLADGYELLSLDMGGENIYDFRRGCVKPFLLAVGSEARGISRYLLDKSDKILSLPMSGKIESLNAAISLGVALYQLVYGGKKS